jgi:DNA-binding MarR family transcriptional regulator
MGMKIEKFLNESPLYNLSAAYNEIIGRFQKVLAKEGVHFLEALILTGLFFEEKPVRPTQLAVTFSCSKSNMSHALRGLEKAGWIERKSSTDDARAYFFSLTKEGRKKVPKLIKAFDSTDDKIERAFAGRKVIPNLKLFRQIYRTSDVSDQRVGQ